MGARVNSTFLGRDSLPLVLIYNCNANAYLRIFVLCDKCIERLAVASGTRNTNGIKKTQP